MDKNIISASYSMKGGVLDDDYILYEDGSVLHEYDNNIYPNGQNLKTHLDGKTLPSAIKFRLLESATMEHKELVKKLLDL